MSYYNLDFKPYREASTKGRRSCPKSLDLVFGNKNEERREEEAKEEKEETAREQRRKLERDGWVLQAGPTFSFPKTGCRHCSQVLVPDKPLSPPAGHDLCSCSVGPEEVVHPPFVS